MTPDDDTSSSDERPDALASSSDGERLSVEAARKIVAGNLISLSDELASIVRDVPSLRARMVAPRANLMDAIALLFPDGVEDI